MDREAGADFANSSALAVVVGVIGGGGVMLIGAAVALNWRGWAQRYTDLTDVFGPPRRANGDAQRLRQNRVIFAVIGLLGSGFLLAGLSSLL